jgi:hypothetical protein
MTVDEIVEQITGRLRRVENVLDTGLHTSSPFAEPLTLTDAIVHVAHELHQIARAIDRLADAQGAQDPPQRLPAAASGASNRKASRAWGRPS